MLNEKLTQKKIQGEFFNNIEIDIQADDLVVSKIEEDICIIKLSIKNNIDDVITEHLLQSDRYNINTEIVNNTLIIKYYKSDMNILLNNPDYFEVIGVIILLPKDKPYKIIKNEE